MINPTIEWPPKINKRIYNSFARELCLGCLNTKEEVCAWHYFEPEKKAISGEINIKIDAETLKITEFNIKTNERLINHDYNWKDY